MTLLKQSLFVLSLVIAGFVMAHPLHLEPATIAMFGAALPPSFRHTWRIWRQDNIRVDMVSSLA